MLKLAKKLAKKYLTKFGYEIYRPTSVEQKFKSSYWKDWFSKEPSKFAEIYVENRRLLSNVQRWITKEVLDSSYWRYGIVKIH